MRYSENMTPLEMVQLEAEIRKLDDAYLDMYDSVTYDDGSEDEFDDGTVLRKAALDCRGRP